MTYDKHYYQNNGQLGDRPALWFYSRLIQHLIGTGPILDFGCGTGCLGRRLSTWTETDGFEISPFAQKLAQQNLPNGRLYSDLQALPCSYYNGIVSLHVLEHIKDDDLAPIFDCWKRITRPGAKFFIVMPEVSGFAHQLKQEKWIGFSDPTHINLKTRSQWVEFVGQKGLAVERIGSDGMWDFPYTSASKWIDVARYGLGTIAQMVSGRLLITPGRGESVILSGRI
jgi:SAM-dependent methyltransferase